MTAVAEVVSAPARTTRALLTATRPKQWVKNALVLAAPAAAGVLLQRSVALSCGLALVAMTLTSAACYLVNDVLDRDLDRLHPTKALRPVASGAVSVSTALTGAALLGLLGLATAAAAGPWVLVVVASYAVLTSLYAVWLKHVPWLELGVVASGFVLRALAGAAAAQVDASEWFLVVVTSAALLVVASKRTSELLRARAQARPALRGYGLAHLRVLRWAASFALIGGYSGWAVFRPDPTTTWLAVASLAPVLLVLSRWERNTSRGETGAPEDVLASDRWVQLGVLAWTAVFLTTVLVALRPR
ncbi:MAG: phosphoribose diphosphate:decaprenyl-phosphate phosphoribosyltransferase [Frankiales bacterium]|jgi:decaprenyl-phosphate phosphoribosyltransferase|nr:phosphoribose diphosphate:decaprenyl-phosphate phosphoribosyltransferase [Frankiales bacterium]